MEKVIREIKEMSHGNSNEVIKNAILLEMSRSLEKISCSLEDIQSSINIKFGYSRSTRMGMP